MSPSVLLMAGSAFCSGVAVAFAFIPSFASYSWLAALSAGLCALGAVVGASRALRGGLAGKGSVNRDDMDSVDADSGAQDRESDVCLLESRVAALEGDLQTARETLTRLKNSLFLDSHVVLPLADAVLCAVPDKTEEAAMALLEKFMAVRDVSAKAAKSAAALQKDLEDRSRTDSVYVLAADSRTAIRDERSVIHELSQCIKGNQEHLGAMGKEITSGLELLKNITDITERSKLIAFNMSIEAARIGEKGRGFKVIITELHRLNERTFEFSRQVSELLGRFREYNQLLVENMDEKAAAVVTQAIRGMDAAETAVDSLVQAVDRTDALVKEVNGMSGTIDHDLDKILESLQFQDITRQMIEGAQYILDFLEHSRDACADLASMSVPDELVKERFNSLRGQLIKQAKTNYEKEALMEVRL